MKQITKLNWRTIWYSVLIWLLAFIVAGIVIIPWFYFVLPISIILITIYYFKIIDPFKNNRGRKRLREKDRIFIFGLAASLFWFLIITILNILQIAGFYYFDFFFYFSDFRNWYLYALILLVPVIYSLILEDAARGKRRNEKNSLFSYFYSSKTAKT
ncbi:hypothetical protein A3A54_01760 [Candidatus Curtissbacteria bacterium RIFCSPLOWO2_01_FULL_39_62]|uniref:Uncharacterized protein n=2 Tax=Candidatus Curtissiibacteriota TaxID=1752717 RepID=A0A1F5G9C4_9BACT|nr:MAG: hypothetical protein A2775_02440 [Candidatus Curtissbacteria bacterium RIFCSPHIGHO2_01_FULL_39_57]OGD88470.1 MAG: hypothetical protein A3D04_00990 [Candidatus Curtissbacteria bacterium RIFCSPHIGHO2_02_FULL_40_16b]OGD90884.1 MAG: hypothetical protein A3E11_02745 [Candidatus Curtissbacteria bacterium RIFCSPHIGHO2_12_FULL_38_37]OGE00330.1 MAG: hypothetical protein A3J17_01505 [Candidatus Curtissbacteria bacterium RIFCSPLOWO2_02_FULL_40_11]OGE00821.1 MAG: hypothetical protein A3A54_01760 [C